MRNVVTSFVLMLSLAFAGCGGSKKSSAPETPGNAAPAETAKAEAMCDDPNCEGGQGTCLALCKGTDDECVKQCAAPVCPKIPCSTIGAAAPAQK